MLWFAASSISFFYFLLSHVFFIHMAYLNVFQNITCNFDELLCDFSFGEVLGYNVESLAHQVFAKRLEWNIKYIRWVLVLCYSLYQILVKIFYCYVYFIFIFVKDMVQTYAENVICLYLSLFLIKFTKAYVLIKTCWEGNIAQI